MEEQEQAFEFERRRFSEMHLAPKPLTHHSYFGYSMDELKLSQGLLILHQKELCTYDFLFVIIFFFLTMFLYIYSLTDILVFLNVLARGEQAEFPSAERFNYLLDVLNNGSTSEDNVRHISTHYNDQER